MSVWPATSNFTILDYISQKESLQMNGGQSALQSAPTTRHTSPKGHKVGGGGWKAQKKMKRFYDILPGKRKVEDDEEVEEEEESL